MKTASALGIVVSLDCIIYPCMFDNKEEWKYIGNFMDKIKSKCEGCPTDIFPDETSSFCYPLKETIKIDTKKYEHISQFSKDMMLRYKLLEEKVSLPEECKKCPFKRANMCNGPCLAFFDLSKETLGINT